MLYPSRGLESTYPVGRPVWDSYDAQSGTPISRRGALCRAVGPAFGARIVPFEVNGDFSIIYLTLVPFLNM